MPERVRAELRPPEGSENRSGGRVPSIARTSHRPAHRGAQVGICAARWLVSLDTAVDDSGLHSKGTRPRYRGRHRGSAACELSGSVCLPACRWFAARSGRYDLLGFLAETDVRARFRSGPSVCPRHADRRSTFEGMFSLTAQQTRARDSPQGHPLRRPRCAKTPSWPPHGHPSRQPPSSAAPPPYLPSSPSVNLPSRAQLGDRSSKPAFRSPSCSTGQKKQRFCSAPDTQSTPVFPAILSHFSPPRRSTYP